MFANHAVSVCVIGTGTAEGVVGGGGEIEVDVVPVIYPVRISCEDTGVEKVGSGVVDDGKGAEFGSAKNSGGSGEGTEEGEDCRV